MGSDQYFIDVLSRSDSLEAKGIKLEKFYSTFDAIFSDLKM